jgi:pimeloyl-ACP methyl ester carboxylesterase
MMAHRSLLVAALLLLGGALRVSAEEVRREHLGLDLLANLELPSGKVLADQPVILILHGNMAHHGMELIRALQHGLKERGYASLAITLSLGLNARKGMFACTHEHEHRASDAIEEIAVWVDWLKSQSVTRITLAGHSRGAAQVLGYAAGNPDALVDRLILIAPPVDGFETVVARYQTAFGGDLRSIVETARRHVEEGEEDKVMDVPGFLSCKGARATAASILDYYAPDPAEHPLVVLKRMRLPVLVVAGSADTISADVPAKIAAAGLPPTVEIAVIDGADHFFRDLHGDDLVDHAKAFAERPPVAQRR